MRLIGSVIDLLAEESTPGGSIHVKIVFDSKEIVQTASVEEIRDTILKQQAHCGLIFYSGGTPDRLEEDIRRVEVRIGKEGIIKLIPMTRRDMDLLLVINKIEDYMHQRNRDQLDLERIDSECRRLWRKVEIEVERLIIQLYERGYILPRYTLEEETSAVLLSLHKAFQDEGLGNILTRAYEKCLVPIFGISFSIYARDIERIEEAASENGLFNREQKSFLMPSFNVNICESLRGSPKISEQIRSNFILADSSHTEKWLNYLIELRIISIANNKYKLSVDIEEWKNRIESIEFTSPDDMDSEDEFGGTLRNFCNHLGYSNIVGMIDNLRKKCIDQINNVSVSDLSNEDFVNNLGAPFALLENACNKVMDVINEARRSKTISISNIEEGGNLYASAVQEVEQINTEINKIRSEVLGT